MTLQVEGGPIPVRLPKKWANLRNLEAGNSVILKGFINDMSG